jgi:6-pyruvoyltetrahydropterin/6-carboxytetrahydropterin synthase
VFILSLSRDFRAWHHLTGGDWGAENEPHTHPYKLELRLEGAELDKHGYLVDLLDVEKNLDDLLSGYREADLNELPEFAGLNPSLEHFARILCSKLFERLKSENLRSLTVRLWENDRAWASYRLEF